MPLLWTALLPLGVLWANCSLQWQPSSEAYCLSWVCTQCFSHLFSWLAPFVPLAYILGVFDVKTVGLFFFFFSHPNDRFYFIVRLKPGAQTDRCFPFEYLVCSRETWPLHSLTFFFFFALQIWIYKCIYLLFHIWTPECLFCSDVGAASGRRGRSVLIIICALYFFMTSAISPVFCPN